MISPSATVPLTGADEWYSIATPTGSETAAVLAGTVPAGADWTVEPEYHTHKIGGLAFDLYPSNAVSDEYRKTISFRVDGSRFIQVGFREVGDTTNLSNLSVVWNVSL